MHRILNHYGRILISKRDETTGNYPMLTEPHDYRKLKNTFGGNGDISNISASFLLKYPTAKYSDFNNNIYLKGQVLSAFKTFDSTAVLSTFRVDTSASNEMELSIYMTVSWLTGDVNAETKANALIAMISNYTNLTTLFTSSTIPSPFDNVTLDTSLEPMVFHKFIQPTIHSLVTTYDSNVGGTSIEVKTVGLYDHIGIKLNSESDDKYRILWTNGVNTLVINGVNPSVDVIIATLFDKNNTKFYTLKQQPFLNADGTSKMYRTVIDSSGVAIPIGDALAPVITLNGNAEVTLNVGDAYVELGATVTDNSGETIMPMITGSVDTNTVGTYTIYYNATDSSGNVAAQITRRIVIQDILSPVITLNGAAEITLNLGDAYVEQGATVTDDSGETITPIISGNVDTNAVGTYTVTYTATDSSGNTSVIHRSVNVKNFKLRRFAGSSSFGSYPNYINLADNTQGLTFSEDSLNVTDYLQGSNHELTFACKFNASVWNDWGRIIDINNGMNQDEIFLKTTYMGTIAVYSYSENHYNANSDVRLVTGIDYYLLFTYSSATSSFTMIISENVDGSLPVVNFTRNDTRFTAGTRAHWGIGMSRYGIERTQWRNEYFEGAITEITISNSVIPWNIAFPSQ